MRADLHTHTIFSDGELIPAELVRRAMVLGHDVVAITDHVDMTNVEIVASNVAKAAELCEDYIRVVPGVEITHVPPSKIGKVARAARRCGAEWIVVHGETVAEPVAPGTNRAAAEDPEIDVLAHPGMITVEEAQIARDNDVILEVSGRKGHSLTNGHVVCVAREVGARMVVDSDAHAPEDLMTEADALIVALGAGMTDAEAEAALHITPYEAVRRIRRPYIREPGHPRRMPRIAIIGGTGIYNPDTFEQIEEVYPDTPYGKPSDPIMVGRINGVEVAFLYRHGRNHQHPPSGVPYRANMMALRDLGCKYIVSACAVGSLKEEYAPGDLVITDDFVDFTKKRDYTYFDDRAVHISLPEPFCPYLNGIFAETAEELGIDYHLGGTYLCIEGPRFSTRAESLMFRNFADIIGMTVVPECQLARELGLCYCSLATVTDYDMWKDEPVDIDMVNDTMARCLDNVLRLLEAGLPKIREECGGCVKAAEGCGAL